MSEKKFKADACLPSTAHSFVSATALGRVLRTLLQDSLSGSQFKDCSGLTEGS